MKHRKRHERISHLEARTAHLTLAHHGAYAILTEHFCRTRMTYGWAEQRLAKVCRATTSEEYDAFLDVLRSFFEEDERGCWKPYYVEAGRDPIPTAVKRAVIERDGDICTYCGDIEGPFQVDHVTPVARGGSNDPDNLAVACRKCNLSKGALLPEEWQGIS